MKTSLEAIVLSEALTLGASDIHIDPLVDGYSIRMRIDGSLSLWKTIDHETGIRIINQIKADAGIAIGTIYHPVGERKCLEIAGEEVDLRITLVPCISGPKLSIRMLDPKRVKRTLPSIGLTQKQSNQLERWLTDLNGMILLTGPTASGKTTTLYALLHQLVEVSRHIVTVEDPVEYEIDGINQIEIDERHGLDFAEGIRTSLRLDPDGVMVGEIREDKVAGQAVRAAIQGHVVMATVHSRDAVSTITRLRNFGVANHQIATALGVVVNQRLVKKLCVHCRSKRAVTNFEESFLSAHDRDEIKESFFSTGCDKCRDTGFMGRTGIFEVWNLDHDDYELILAGADEDTIRSHRRRGEFPQLVDPALDLITDGVVSVRETMRLGLSLPWENE